MLEFNTTITFPAAPLLTVILALVGKFLTKVHTKYQIFYEIPILGNSGLFKNSNLITHILLLPKNWAIIKTWYLVWTLLKAKRNQFLKFHALI